MPLPDAKGLEGRKEGEDQAPQSRDFFWDSITLYVVAIILSLTVIDVVTEFVRDSKVQCFLPNDTDTSLTSDVRDYVNEFCSGRLPALQFLPSVIAIHAIAILAPHYIWLNAYGADLDFFFRHVSKLERTRKAETGDYPPINYAISNQMEEAFSKFSRPNGMYWLYIVKLFLQVVLCVVGIVLVPVTLFKREEQNVVFECPTDESDTKGDSWPLPDYETVVCVFSPLYLLQKIWVGYLFLLALAAFFLLVNFFLLVKWHTHELGFENCAEFSFQTGISYHQYHPQIVSKVLQKNLSSPPIELFSVGSESTVKALGRIKERLLLFLFPFSPYSIQSDYDFLMVKLFRTDGGLAYIMKELHIMRLLQAKNRSDLGKLSLYKTTTDSSNREFIRADIDWKLPDEFQQHKHVPMIDSDMLVLPKTFRGVVLGCALRCEGGHQYIGNLKNYADRCVKIAGEQKELAEDQLKLTNEQLIGTHGDLSKKAEEHLKKARNLQARVVNLRKNERDIKNQMTDFSEKQKILAKHEQDLELSMQRMKQELEMEASAEKLKNKAEAKLPKHYAAIIRKRPGKVTNVNAEQQIGDSEMEEDDLKDDGSGKKVESVRQESEGAEVGREKSSTRAEIFEDLQQSLSDHCWSLLSTANTTIGLQQLVRDMREEVEEIANVLSNKQMEFKVEDEKRDLRQNLDSLLRELQDLTCQQQELAKDRQSRNHLERALRLSGTRLQNALVIGFDMESEGLPIGLARIFCRVGFINFSSNYTDYQNPLKVSSSSYFLFNATAPVDVITNASLFEPEPPTDSEEKMTVSDKVLDAMNEVWREDYSQQNKTGVMTYSNYVVIGPVSTHIHIATVNRILGRYNYFLSRHAVLLTIKPRRIGSVAMEFLDYTPPLEYDEITPLNNMRLEEGIQNWPEGPAPEDTGGSRAGYSPLPGSLVNLPTAGSRSSNDPFKIQVEDTTIEYCFKLYRKK